jgi:hypothetical protein
MTEATEEILKSLPQKLLRPALSIAVGLAAYLLWTNHRPEVVQAPLATELRQVHTGLDRLTERVDTIAWRQEERGSQSDAMQRWMCFQNRLDAVKAGIPCKRLMEE